ncbi:MAG: sialidase family protein [Gaiellales bacterium]
MKRRAMRGAALAIAVSTVALVAGASPAAWPSGATFTNYELAGLPGAPAGVSCPGHSNCYNQAAEPAIRVSPAGKFFASSENGLGSGTDAWRSLDGGGHFTQLPCPDCGSQTNSTGFAPGGGDTDLAIAPVKNSSGNYNVYVASLSLANVDVSTSQDNGASWSLNPIGATISGDDREWIAADGASKVCMSYHDAATFNIDVNCSSDAGATFTQLGEAIDTSHAYAINANETGNMAIDTSTASPYHHTVYQTFSAVNSTADQATCISTGPCNYRDVFVAVSTDGGQTFTDHLVHRGTATTSYGHQFVNVTVDRAGNVYSVYSNDHATFMSYSTNQGVTWSAPVKVNTVATAIMPWAVALAPGKIDVVYYGSPYSKSGVTPDNYPSTAQWKVFLAQDVTATTGGTFSQVAATPVIHFGGVCESGVTCQGNRDLYDDFGVAVGPSTGLATIVYSDDQYINTAASPPAPGCAAAQTNTGACDHTSIAKQTGGTTIN